MYCIFGLFEVWKTAALADKLLPKLDTVAVQVQIGIENRRIKLFAYSKLSFCKGKVDIMKITHKIIFTDISAHPYGGPHPRVNTSFTWWLIPH